MAGQPEELRGARPLTLAEVADLLEGRHPDDHVAAEAYDLFGRGVFPYTGAFLSPDVTSEEALADTLRRGAARGAWAWVPAFCVAVRDEGSALGDAVADALEDWLAAERDLDAGRARAALGEDASAVPSLEDADLDELVGYLATPCRCGVFLSALALERIGREQDVPRGFGGRRRVLRQLLLQGSRYESLPGVLAGLSAVVARHEERFAGAPWAGRESAAVWGARARATRQLLDGMRAGWEES